MILKEKHTMQDACWSDTLIKQTRELIYCPSLNIGPYLYMKNINGRFGEISFGDLLARKLTVVAKDTDEIFFYTSCDEMINAGWAVD